MPRKEAKDLSAQEILDKAMARALRGGVAGASAMAIQVCSLMWMRTTMNYQYRHGEPSTLNAIRILYKEGAQSGLAFGGIRRFYMGLGPALFQGPLSRFGDTAANSGTLALLEANPTTNKLPVGLKTFAASCAAAGWRMVIMPIDAMKTIAQVEGKGAIGKLFNKVRAGGPIVLWHGAFGAYGATLVGHYPWFFVNNYLEATLPKVSKGENNYIAKKLLRNAGIGFAASVTSDCCSNSIRVIKTVKQTSTVPITYVGAFRTVVDKDGYRGLFGRGLKTRIMANGMQGIMFKVLWKLFEDKLNAKK
mmetsp:Transcript_19142/g.38699  ORF Transcript_19142/g.38699 Transcript_19142/m.38699 type:complete len:305 (-) Transcript_19142:154-1068(-)